MSPLGALRHALRVFAREPSFGFTVVATFALCVAANVAIFAVVNAVLLRPLPYAEPDRLVTLYNTYPKAGVERAGSSVPHYLERRDNLKALGGLAAFRNRDAIVGEAGRPERVVAARVTPNFFELLGRVPAQGRTFRAEEGEAGKNTSVILSHAYWEQNLGADPDAVGKTLRVDGAPLTIVGIMPRDFGFEPTKKARLWLALAFVDDELGPDRRHSNGMEVVGRLAPGSSVEQLQSQVDALNAAALEGDPYKQAVIDAGFRTLVASLGDDLTRNARHGLWLLQGGALLVLLIGAVNLANLILVRASARAKEMAIRRVLGAGSAAIARQLLVENTVLALVGGGLGVLLGAAVLPALRPLGLGSLPRGNDAAVDGIVALVAIGLAVATGVVLALPPLLQHLGGKVASALSVESRGGTTNRRQSRVREALIVAQIALAFVLLTGAGLLTLSFARVVKVDPGFQPDRLLTAQVNLPRPRFADLPLRRAYVHRLLQELQALPGVKSVAISSATPFSGQVDSNVMTAEGYQTAPGESVQAPYTTAVAGDFFETLGFPLRDGRFLTAADADAEALLAVIDERFARRYWPDRSPVGQRIRNGTGDEKDLQTYTIVGVVGSVKQQDLAEPGNAGAIYMNYRHQPSPGLVITVRTDLLPAALAPALQQTALRVDPEVPLFDVQTMSERVTATLGARRTPMVLSAAFATGALLLAGVGIYGVLAYTVAQRRREIGIRLALGALPAQVHAMFLRLGARLFLLGLLIGAPLVWWLGALLRGQLYGVEPANPWVLTGGAVFVGGAALAAAFIPARRAAATPAMEALRSE